MNYTAIYDKLIARAVEVHGHPKNKHHRQRRKGYEIHHISPASLGGTDESGNLCYLTYKEHFVAHHLLWKITKHPKMALAFKAMCNAYTGTVTAKTVSDVKAAAKLAVSTSLLGNQRRKGIPHPEETKAKISAAQKGVSRWTEASLAKLSATKTGTKQKIVTCPRCGKSGGMNNMNRYHFDNCKKTQCQTS